jgi:hypothetical protein
MTSKLSELFETIRIALCKLNQIQFDAPWKPSQGGC